MTSRRWLAKSDSGASEDAIICATCGARNRCRRPIRSISANCSATRCFEQAVPARELLGLLLQLRRLQLHRIVKFLDAEQRAHAGDQRCLLERLGEIVVAAGLEAMDDVARVGFGGHEDDRDEAKRCIPLELLQHRDAVELRHHDVEQDEIGLELARRASASSPSTAVTTS